MPSPLPYCCNLKEGDEVYDVHANRFGKVERTPRTSSRRIAVLYDGINTPRYVFVGNLRLSVGKKVVEDVPPVDGEVGEESTIHSDSAVARGPDARNAEELVTELRATIRRFVKDKWTALVASGALDAVKNEIVAKHLSAP